MNDTQPRLSFDGEMWRCNKLAAVLLIKSFPEAIQLKDEHDRSVILIPELGIFTLNE